MTTTQIVKLHKTLSDKTRFEIFDKIWNNPNISGKELLAEFHISQPTLSFHITKLETNKLIVVEKIGQSHYYKANMDMLKPMLEYGMKIFQINKKQG